MSTLESISGMRPVFGRSHPFRAAAGLWLALFSRSKMLPRRATAAPKGRPRFPRARTTLRFAAYFFFSAAFLMIGVAFFASASVSKPRTAENFLPITWAMKNAMLISAAAIALAIA